MGVLQTKEQHRSRRSGTRPIVRMEHTHAKVKVVVNRMQAVEKDEVHLP